MHKSVRLNKKENHKHNKDHKRNKNKDRHNRHENRHEHQQRHHGHSNRSEEERRKLAGPIRHEQLNKETVIVKKLIEEIRDLQEVDNIDFEEDSSEHLEYVKTRFALIQIYCALLEHTIYSFKQILVTRHGFDPRELSRNRQVIEALSQKRVISREMKDKLIKCSQMRNSHQHAFGQTDDSKSTIIEYTQFVRQVCTEALEVLEDFANRSQHDHKQDREQEREQEDEQE